MYPWSWSQSPQASPPTSSPNVSPEVRNQNQNVNSTIANALDSIFGSQSSNDGSSISREGSVNSVWGSGSSGQLGSNEYSQDLGSIPSSQGSNGSYSYHGSQNTQQFYEEALPRMSLSQSSTDSDQGRYERRAFEETTVQNLSQFLPSSNESGSNGPASKRSRFYDASQ